nr:hypothetical protein B11C_190030 [Bartonella sp. 1-1C]
MFYGIQSLPAKTMINSSSGIWQKVKKIIANSAGQFVNGDVKIT